jgi:hypothetical protein
MILTKTNICRTTKRRERVARKNFKPFLCSKSRPMTALELKTVFLFSLWVTAFGALAQPPDTDSSAILPVKQVSLLSLEPAGTLHKGRFWLSAGTGAAVYGGFSIALWNAWYKDYPLTRFHTFNDWGEWKDMDKAGHFFSAWLESHYVFQGACWTGMKRRSAMWTAVGVGMGLQATIEVMDGFSEEWGFSFGDVGFNTLGVSFFAMQELLWAEQRIHVRVSGIRPGYSDEPLFSADGGQATTLDRRAAGLYGTSFFHVLLKDYNALTVWGSANIHSFLPNKEESNFPRWLNLALGYGAENLYGGFANEWTDEQGNRFVLDPGRYPRYRQFYLAPDVDWTRIPTKKRWARFALGLLNWVKFPAPALEVNTLGRVKVHAIYW